MKKMRKIFAVLLTLAMVLGMSMTSFAADAKATIILKNFDKANKVEYMQIIQKDETKTSGWTFTNGAGACFTEAFGLTDSDDAQQQVIWGLIKYNDNNVKLPTGVTAKTATAANIDLALSKVATLKGFTESTDKTKIEVSAAGIYAIKAEETGFTYKTATAYVGFGEPYPALTNAEVTAKKSPTTVDKTVADDDHVVAIGDIVTYTIEAYVPFIDAANTDNRTFTITDKIKGAEYYLAGPNAVSSVTMEGKEGQVGEIVVNEDGKGFTVNLNTLVADTDNPNAGKKITVTYTATVNENAVTGINPNTNKASVTYSNDPSTDGTGTSEEVHADVYTFAFDIYKYTLTDDQQADAEGNRTALADAQFKLYAANGDAKGDEISLVDESNGVYRQAKDDTETKVEYITTGDTGIVTIKGLKDGTYYLTETKAPDGFNKLVGDIKVEINNLTYAADDATKLESFDVVYTMPDKTSNTVKVNAIDGKAEIPVRNNAGTMLPSTGGNGGIVFTIVGVAIIGVMMVSSLVSKKRKNAK